MPQSQSQCEFQVLSTFVVNHNHNWSEDYQSINQGTWFNWWSLNFQPYDLMLIVVQSMTKSLDCCLDNDQSQSQSKFWKTVQCWLIHHNNQSSIPRAKFQPKTINMISLINLKILLQNPHIRTWHFKHKITQ
jgi:hypothetical protein